MTELQASLLTLNHARKYLNIPSNFKGISILIAIQLLINTQTPSTKENIVKTLNTKAETINPILYKLINHNLIYKNNHRFYLSQIAKIKLDIVNNTFLKYCQEISDNSKDPI